MSIIQLKVKQMDLSLVALPRINSISGCHVIKPVKVNKTATLLDAKGVQFIIEEKEGKGGKGERGKENEKRKKGRKERCTVSLCKQARPSLERTSPPEDFLKLMYETGTTANVWSCIRSATCRTESPEI